MRLFPLLLLAGALADLEFSSRIQEAQKLLISNGPSIEVLGDYDSLIADLENSTQEIPLTSVAQAYYQKALVEIGLNKFQPAINDLSKTLELDPSLSPASDKLIELLLERGQFQVLKSKFSQAQAPAAYGQIAKWQDGFNAIQAYLQGTENETNLQHSLSLLENVLIPITPSYPAVYDLKLQCLKRKATLEHFRSYPVDFDGIVTCYWKYVKVVGPRDLDLYKSFAEYLLFVKGNFQDSWNTVKNCLRIDNDYKPCGSLTKIYSRLQSFLIKFEDYFVVDEFLYPQTQVEFDMSEEKQERMNIDYEQMFRLLTGPVSLPKQEMNKLPSKVKTLYDFLIYRAEDFCARELQDATMSKKLPFVVVLNKLMCESSIRVDKDRAKMCGVVDDSDQPFFPKNVPKIDYLLKHKKLQEAKEALSQYSKNVQKTDLFKQRWAPIQQMEERQRQQHQQRQQQEHFRQQQQRQQQHQQQQQQQQQQQSNFDSSKDYYKILDVAKDADEKTIKKAYRAQTLKYHPDKYKGGDLSEKEIETKMQEINEAYEVLSNKETRDKYDRGPTNQGGFQGGSGGGGGGFQFHFNPEDVMAQFMKGQGGFRF